MLSQMKWVRTVLAALMVLALLFGSAVAKKPVPPPEPPPEPDPPPVMYTITWLDDFEYTEPHDINSLGHVVGEAMSPTKYEGEKFAFTYTPQTGMVDLNTMLPAGTGWHLRVANDINDQGQVVGTGENAKGIRYAFLYTPADLTEDGIASVIELGVIGAGDQHSTAQSINGKGEVCGWTQDVDGVYHVWFYSPILGQVDLLSEPDGSRLYATTINETGQILVSVMPMPSDAIEYVIRLTPLGDPDYFYLGSCFYSYDMNDVGEFVGLASFEIPINKTRSTYESRAVRHDGTSILDLGAGIAWGINNAGDVVGNLPRDLYTGRYGAFVYLDALQQFVNLDDAIVGDELDLLLWFESGTYHRTTRINDAGQIIGFIGGSEILGDGNVRGYILTPITP